MNVTLVKSNRDNLQTAIDHWYALADEEERYIELDITYGSDAVYRYRAETYRRAAKALEIQRDTGVAVCSCCHKPFGRGISFLNRNSA